MNLTEEQKEKLGILDERVDYYFKVENTVVDGFKVVDSETGKESTEMAFENIYQAHLFVVLSRYCNNGQVAYPSISTLCKKCYCSKPTLLKAIEGLEKKGYIAKVNRYNSETKTNESNV
ncbi:MAG: helix-turn-helix domain-containing protein, partial [Paraclostridium sp.]